MSNKQECTFTSVAPYPKVRQLAHGLKDGDYASICKAAEMMADGIREMAAGRNCVLVPIPNHHGRAVYTKTLANEITRRTGILTWDILSCRPHMPLHYAKKNDLKPEGIYLKLNLYRQVPEQFTPIVIDNVLDTGYTAGAAIKAVGHPNTMLAVLGHTKNHLTNKNYQFNQLATNMEKKMQEQPSDKKQSADSTKKQVKNETDTPLAVYQRLKSKHPDALILMRNGDFYRSLNEDAQKVSDTLRIPTQKPKSQKDGELIAEFPHHALDVYLPRLIRAGNRVAIADMLELGKKQTTKQAAQQTKNQTQTDTMEKKTEKKKTKAKEVKVDKTETAKVDKTEVKAENKADTKKEDKAVDKTAEQSAGQKVHKPREPQMVTVNGEKVSHGHAFQSNQDPNKWYFTARLDGQQLRPQLMKPEDVAAYQKREIGVEALMQTYYPTKLAKKVTPEEYKADNKLSDGRVIEKMVVYKEHDEQRHDVGKYKLYTQVGEQKMSRTMSKEDLNAYFDRVTTPSKLVEKNFGEQLHLASFYNQFKLEEGVKDVRIAKNYDGDWTVSAKLTDDRTTSKAVLSWHDKQALFTQKTATKEQLAARYLNTEIKEMKQEKVSAKQAFSR
ncbi:DNA mismatch repair protein MutS [Hallella mizrahii]|uniref:DNA mismatch repair protein MutS n=1 Tax=Hallella mizrahii TaxID=2606637 RepID=A0A7K0KH73_9BACT|nr:DNA mismatch repair protein MutS [Hallella mizrahii]MST85286.1 DNA mismatch repair protein MutS [Hallella mizrahii]